MADGFAGYPSSEAFVAAVEAEVAKSEAPEPRQQSVDHVSRPEREEPQEPIGYRGAPMSEERLQQVREIAQTVGMQQQFDQELGAQQLSKLLGAYLEYDGDNPQLGEQVSQQIARSVVQIDDPGVWQQVQQHLDETPVLGRVQELVGNAVQAQIERHEQATEEQRQAASEGRQRVLQSELDRLHPGDAQLVLEAIPADEMYALDEDEARLQMRTVAELGAAQRSALKGFGFEARLTEELKRYGPARASDEQRAEFERELEANTLRNYDRASLSPEQAADRAVESVRREHTHASPGLEALNEELAKHSKSDEQVNEEVARSKRNFPEHHVPTGRFGGIDTKQPTRTSQTTWET